MPMSCRTATAVLMFCAATIEYVIIAHGDGGDAGVIRAPAAVATAATAVTKVVVGDVHTAPLDDRGRCGDAAFADRPLTVLEGEVLRVLETLQSFPNITVWPVGGMLIHLVRHGRYSDYEEHDQEFDVDLGIASPDNDTRAFPPDVGQWIVNTLAQMKVLREHKLTSKKSPPGTGTCRLWAKGKHVACKHVSLGLHLDFFLGGPASPTDTPVTGERLISYAPLGEQQSSFLHPMKRCRAWSGSIACPRDPYLVLKTWGVHTGYEPKEGCLLFPRHVQRALQAVSAGGGQVDGKTRAAVSYVVDRAAKLHSCGFSSFAGEIEHNRECQDSIRLASASSSRP